MKKNLSLLTLFLLVINSSFAQDLTSIEYNPETNQVCFNISPCHKCLVGSLELQQSCLEKEQCIQDCYDENMEECMKDCYYEGGSNCDDYCGQLLGSDPQEWSDCNAECFQFYDITASNISIEYRIEAATAPISSGPRTQRDNWIQTARVVESYEDFSDWNCLTLDENWTEIIDGINVCYWATATMRFTDENGNQRFCPIDIEYCEIIG